jgi:hypothetical protein
VPRWVKVVVWVVVFAACAGAGAFVASRTNPFPPGVEDPGARAASPTAAATPSPPPTVRWQIELHSATEHELHVGGTCRSSWSMAVELEGERPRGLSATGVARLTKGGACQFATAQVQARKLPMSVSGAQRNGSLVLTFGEDGDPLPAGSTDLGGFIGTLPIRVVLAAGGSSARGKAIESRGDGDLGRYKSQTLVVATCLEMCSA